MTWIPGTGWQAPLEPPNVRQQILAWATRWVPLELWERHKQITIDHSQPKQTQKIERPRFGRKGA